MPNGACLTKPRTNGCPANVPLDTEVDTATWAWLLGVHMAFCFGSRCRQTRELFVAHVNSLFTNALQMEVGKGSSLTHSSELSTEADPARFQQTLRRHYDTVLYGRVKSASQVSTDDSKVAGDHGDDLVTPINLAAYMKFRARMISVYLERRAPVLSRQLQMLEVAAQACNAASAILALPLVDLGQWVAISIACSTLIYSVRPHTPSPLACPHIPSPSLGVHAYIYERD